MTLALEPVSWRVLDADEVEGLNLLDQPEIVPPLGETGTPCPWPWEFTFLPFAPADVHTCSRCGTRGTPGIEHPDFSGMIPERK